MRELRNNKMNNAITEKLKIIVNESIDEKGLFTIEKLDNVEIYNIKTKYEFWVNMFLKHDLNDEFEIQEIYPNKNGLSIYVEYKGDNQQ